MCSEIEAKDDTCSQTFAEKLEEYFSVFVPKI